MGFFIPLMLSLFFVLSSSFTFLINTNKQFQHLKKSGVKSVSAKLAMIAGTIEYGMRNQQMSLVKTIMSNISTDPDVMLLALIDQNGVITASDRNIQIGKKITDANIIPAKLQPQLVQSIKNTQNQLRQNHDFVSINSENDTLIGYSPVNSSIAGASSKYPSVLVLVYSLTTSKDNIRADGYRTLGIQLIVNLIITMLIALIFHFKITRRAQSLLLKINAFIAGDDNVVIRESSTDEIGLIAKGLNKLFLSIQSKTESLALKTTELSRLNRALTLENKERKAAENSAAELLEFNQKIIADSGYGILVYDDSLQCVLVNPFIEQVFNVHRSSLVGKAINTPPLDCVFSQELLEDLKAARPITGHIFYYRTYWLDLSASIIVYKEKRAFLLTINDITQQKQISDQQSRALSAAEAANRSKSNFLANMSHEIRTPMNSILGIAELLKDTQLTNEQSELLRRLENSGSNLLFLINDILDLSKIEAGQLNFDTVDFDLRKLAEETIGILSIPAFKKGLEVKLEIAPELHTFYKGDPLRIKQILINLIGNSIKFTNSGFIKLEIKPQTSGPEPGTIFFRVLDSGIGISEATRQNLFKPFFQADASTTRLYGGTGLGLTICRELVTRMRGAIWVDSTVNVGSVFSFTLTLPPGELIGAEVKRDSAGDPTRIEMPKEAESSLPEILIIDDSEENRFLVKRFLKKLPITISEAENGELGLQKLKTGRYALALIDIQMPVMDGNTTIKQSRVWEKTHCGAQKIPLIVLTANAMKEDFEYSLSLGADSYITKPVNKMNLIKEVSKYLNLEPKADQTA